MTTRFQVLTILAGLLTLALVLAGCASDDATAVPTPVSTPTLLFYYTDG